jgi:hypothetical protein
MSVAYLKKSSRTAETGHQDVQTTVQSMLDELGQGGEAIACHLARKFYHWDAHSEVYPHSRIIILFLNLGRLKYSSILEQC